MASTNLVRRSTPQPLSKISIDNVRIFDGQRMSRPRNITIDGEYISDCTDNVTQRIDASGKFLIPGLIESHAHPSSIQSLEDLTSYGVTTVMSMACKNYTLCAGLKDVTGLTDFYTAGVPAQGPNSSHAINMNTPPSQLVYPNSDPAQLVDWVFGNNSDYYKITVEINGPTQELQNGIVRETHALGRQTMSHAADIASYSQAIRSGTDGIQHTPSDGLLSRDTIRALEALPDTYVTPTMTIYTYYFANPEGFARVSGSAVTQANASYANIQNNVRAMHRAGVPILAGTDAVGRLDANISVPFGYTLHQELQNLVAAGMRPAEALNAATRVPAKWHRLDKRGEIAVGQRADLLLLNSNPLLNISNTLDIERVWAAGREYLDVSKRG